MLFHAKFTCIYIKAFKILDNVLRIITLFISRGPRFAGSNPAEIDGIFSGRKNSEHKSTGTGFNPWVPSLRFQAR